jgi:hypothetical protein
MDNDPRCTAEVAAEGCVAGCVAGEVAGLVAGDSANAGLDNAAQVTRTERKAGLRKACSGLELIVDRTTQAPDDFWIVSDGPRRHYYYYAGAPEFHPKVGGAAIVHTEKTPAEQCSAGVSLYSCELGEMRGF